MENKNKTEFKKTDVFINRYGYKVIAKIVNGCYVYWKFSSKNSGEQFFVGPHFLARKEDKEREHYDIYHRRKKVGKLEGYKPPKFAGMILSSGMVYPMLNGYICVINYGQNGEHGFIDLNQFNRMRRLYKIVQKNNIGQPILVSRIRSVS